MIRIAYGSVPKESGTFTFYRNHRKEFLNRGIEMFSVSVGSDQKQLWNDQFADDHCVMLAASEHRLKKQAMCFVDWCVENEIDIVMAINSPAIVSALPHLPEDIRVVSRCANAFPEGYEVTVAGYDRLSRIVALTPRLRDDLVRDYSVNPDLIKLIPNGVDVDRFQRLVISRDASSKLQLGFLGRLEHKQKGVFYLPKIVELLVKADLDFHLRIAGTGQHEAELRERLKPSIESGHVQFVGMLESEEVVDFLEQTEIYLFTSHFEGCPNALLEAMAAGCAPVSWTIDGITDFLIADGSTGVLVPMGDCDEFANSIIELAANPKNRNHIRQNAQNEGRTRFSIEQCAMEYEDVFSRAMESPQESLEVLPWQSFQTPELFRKRLGWLPPSIRNLIKKLIDGLRSKRLKPNV